MCTSSPTTKTITPSLIKADTFSKNSYSHNFLVPPSFMLTTLPTRAKCRPTETKKIKTSSKQLLLRSITMNLLLLAPYTPIILILGGITAASWLIRKLSMQAPVVGPPTNAAVKIMSLFGFLVGILMLATAAGVCLSPAWDSGTRYLLLVTGLALILKPLKDVPWAAFIGLVIGSLCAGLVYIAYPLPEIILGISSTWVYLAIFLIPALLVYVFFKFAEDLLKLVGTILASRPIATTLGLLCLLQGILLLLNVSIFTSFLP